MVLKVSLGCVRGVHGWGVVKMLLEVSSELDRGCILILYYFLKYEK